MTPIPKEVILVWKVELMYFYYENIEQSIDPGCKGYA